jgi:beta-glucosidase
MKEHSHETRDNRFDHLNRCCALQRGGDGAIISWARAEIHTRGIEDHLFAQRFRRAQHLRAPITATDRPPGFNVLPFPTSFPHMNSEWLRIGPEVIYWGPRIAAKIWNIETIYVSENGTSSEDKLAADGQVDDLDRIMFLRNYMTQMHRAIVEGVPIRGYFLWSLMDNFEWIFGFNKGFGLYRVDFQTQARVPKLSAAFYRDVVARNAIAV